MAVQDYKMAAKIANCNENHNLFLLLTDSTKLGLLKENLLKENLLKENLHKSAYSPPKSFRRCSNKGRHPHTKPEVISRRLERISISRTNFSTLRANIVVKNVKISWKKARIF
jgi:hypothetical protein